MPQFARPQSDTVIGGWTTDSGATTNLFAAIDESSPLNSDYIISSTSTNEDKARFKLNTGLINPIINTNHVLKYNYYKQGAATVNLVVRIVEGTEKLITEVFHGNVGTSVIANEITLSTTDAAKIVDYNDLYIEFVKQTDVTWEDLGQNATINALSTVEAKKFRHLLEYNGRIYIAYGDFNGNVPTSIKAISWNP